MSANRGWSDSYWTSPSEAPAIQDRYQSRIDTSNDDQYLYGNNPQRESVTFSSDCVREEMPQNIRSSGSVQQSSYAPQDGSFGSSSTYSSEYRAAAVIGPNGDYRANPGNFAERDEIVARRQYDSIDDEYVSPRQQGSFSSNVSSFRTRHPDIPQADPQPSGLRYINQSQSSSHGGDAETAYNRQRSSPSRSYDDRQRSPPARSYDADVYRNDSIPTQQVRGVSQDLDRLGRSVEEFGRSRDISGIDCDLYDSGQNMLVGRGGRDLYCSDLDLGCGDKGVDNRVQDVGRSVSSIGGDGHDHSSWNPDLDRGNLIFGSDGQNLTRTNLDLTRGSQDVLHGILKRDSFDSRDLLTKAQPAAGKRDPTRSDNFGSSRVTSKDSETFTKAREIAQRTQEILSKIGGWKQISLQPSAGSGVQVTERPSDGLVYKSNSAYTQLSAKSSVAQTLLRNISMMAATLTDSAEGGGGGITVIKRREAAVPTQLTSSAAGRSSAASSIYDPKAPTDDRASGANRMVSRMSPLDRTTKEESCDPVVENVLKSIGFNFELSQLMQQKAKEKREKEEEEQRKLEEKQRLRRLYESLEGTSSTDAALAVKTPAPPSRDALAAARQHKQQQLKLNRKASTKFYDALSSSDEELMPDSTTAPKKVATSTDSSTQQFPSLSSATVAVTSVAQFIPASTIQSAVPAYSGPPVVAPLARVLPLGAPLVGGPPVGYGAPPPGAWFQGPPPGFISYPPPPVGFMPPPLHYQPAPPTQHFTQPLFPNPSKPRFPHTPRGDSAQAVDSQEWDQTTANFLRRLQEPRTSVSDESKTASVAPRSNTVISAGSMVGKAIVMEEFVISDDSSISDDDEDSSRVLKRDQPLIKPGGITRTIHNELCVEEERRDRRGEERRGGEMGGGYGDLSAKKRRLDIQPGANDQRKHGDILCEVRTGVKPGGAEVPEWKGEQRFTNSSVSKDKLSTVLPVSRGRSAGRTMEGSSNEHDRSRDRGRKRSRESSRGRSRDRSVDSKREKNTTSKDISRNRSVERGRNISRDASRTSRERSREKKRSKSRSVERKKKNKSRSRSMERRRKRSRSRDTDKNTSRSKETRNRRGRTRSRETSTDRIKSGNLKFMTWSQHIARNGSGSTGRDRSKDRQTSIERDGKDKFKNRHEGHTARDRDKDTSRHVDNCKARDIENGTSIDTVKNASKERDSVTTKDRDIKRDRNRSRDREPVKPIDKGTDKEKDMITATEKDKEPHKDADAEKVIDMDAEISRDSTSIKTEGNNVVEIGTTVKTSTESDKETAKNQSPKSDAKSALAGVFERDKTKASPTKNDRDSRSICRSSVERRSSPSKILSGTVASGNMSAGREERGKESGGSGGDVKTRGKDEKGGVKTEERVGWSCFDDGGHWCEKCDRVFDDLAALLKHLLTSEHQKFTKLGADEDDRSRPSKRSPMQLDKSRLTVPVSAKGVEFMMPAFGYYCSLCRRDFGRRSFAQEHLLSEDHYKKYVRYVQDRPTYDEKYMLKKFNRTGKVDQPVVTIPKICTKPPATTTADMTEKKGPESVSFDTSSELNSVKNAHLSRLSFVKPETAVPASDAVTSATASSVEILSGTKLGGEDMEAPGMVPWEEKGGDGLQGAREKEVNVVMVDDGVEVDGELLQDIEKELTLMLNEQGAEFCDLGEESQVGVSERKGSEGENEVVADKKGDEMEEGGSILFDIGGFSPAVQEVPVKGGSANESIENEQQTVNPVVNKLLTFVSKSDRLEADTKCVMIDDSPPSNPPTHDWNEPINVSSVTISDNEQRTSVEHGKPRTAEHVLAASTDDKPIPNTEDIVLQRHVEELKLGSEEESSCYVMSMSTDTMRVSDVKTVEAVRSEGVMDLNDELEGERKAVECVREAGEGVKGRVSEVKDEVEVMKTSERSCDMVKRMMDANAEVVEDNNSNDTVDYDENSFKTQANKKCGDLATNLEIIGSEPVELVAALLEHQSQTSTPVSLSGLTEKPVVVPSKGMLFESEKTGNPVIIESEKIENPVLIESEKILENPSCDESPMLSESADLADVGERLDHQEEVRLITEGNEDIVFNVAPSAVDQGTLDNNIASTDVSAVDDRIGTDRVMDSIHHDSIGLQHELDLFDVQPVTVESQPLTGQMAAEIQSIADQVIAESQPITDQVTAESQPMAAQMRAERPMTDHWSVTAESQPMTDQVTTESQPITFQSQHIITDAQSPLIESQLIPAEVVPLFTENWLTKNVSCASGNTNEANGMLRTLEHSDNSEQQAEANICFIELSSEEEETQHDVERDADKHVSDSEPDDDTDVSESKKLTIHNVSADDNRDNIHMVFGSTEPSADQSGMQGETRATEGGDNNCELWGDFNVIDMVEGDDEREVDEEGEEAQVEGQEGEVEGEEEADKEGRKELEGFGEEHLEMGDGEGVGVENEELEGDGEMMEDEQRVREGQEQGLGELRGGE